MSAMLRRFFQPRPGSSSGAPGPNSEDEVDAALGELCVLQTGNQGQLRSLSDEHFLRMVPFLKLLDAWHGRYEFEEAWEYRPRLYTLLRAVNALSFMQRFVSEGFTDMDIPFHNSHLPAFVADQSIRRHILELQSGVCTTAKQLESRDHHFQTEDDIKLYLAHVKRLGSGRNTVDQVYSRLSLKHYARKQVYRGRDSVKSREEKQRIFDEIRLLKGLHHQHVVRIAGSYSSKEYIGILLEPVAQCNLHEFMTKFCTANDSSEARVILRTFFGCLAGGVSYLHSENVRHRDLKPHNILITLDDLPKVYIADFDAALQWTDSRQGTTQHHMAPRTRDYMAPETAKQGSRRNTMTDMWSLGLVFLEMVSVLKGFSISAWAKYLARASARTNTEPLPCYNVSVCKDFLNHIRKKDASNTIDNVPLAWIKFLLEEVPENRLDSKKLVKDIVDSPYQHDFSCQECLDQFQDPGFFSHGSHSMDYEIREARKEEIQKEIAAFKNFPDEDDGRQIASAKLVSSISSWRDNTLTTATNPTIWRGANAMDPPQLPPSRRTEHSNTIGRKHRPATSSFSNLAIPGAFNAFSTTYPEDEDNFDDSFDQISDDSESINVDLEDEEFLSADELSVNQATDTAISSPWLPYVIAEAGNNSDDSLSLADDTEQPGLRLLTPILEEWVESPSIYAVSAASTNDITEALMLDDASNFPTQERYGSFHCRPQSHDMMPRLRSPAATTESEHQSAGTSVTGSEQQVMSGPCVVSVLPANHEGRASEQPVAPGIDSGIKPEAIGSGNKFSESPTTMQAPAIHEQEPCPDQADPSVNVLQKDDRIEESPAPIGNHGPPVPFRKTNNNIVQDHWHQVLDEAPRKTYAPPPSFGDSTREDFVYSTIPGRRQSSPVPKKSKESKKGKAPVEQADANIGSSNVTSLFRSETGGRNSAVPDKHEYSLSQPPTTVEPRKDSRSNEKTVCKTVSHNAMAPFNNPTRSNSVSKDCDTSTATNEEVIAACESIAISDLPSEQGKTNKTDKPSRKFKAVTDMGVDNTQYTSVANEATASSIENHTNEVPSPHQSETTNDPPPSYEASVGHQHGEIEGVRPSTKRKNTKARVSETLERSSEVSQVRPRSGWTRKSTARRLEGQKSFALSAKNLSRLDANTKPPKPITLEPDSKESKPAFDPATYIDKAFESLELAASDVSSALSETTSKKITLAQWMTAGGQNTLNECCYKGKPGGVSVLLKRGFNPGTTSRYSPKPLLFAMKSQTKEHNSCIRRLIDYGCDVNAVYGGTTPIHRLVAESYFDGYYRRAALLLMAGANLDTPDASGNYCILKILGGPMHRLEEYRVQTLAMFLHKKLPMTVDVNVKDPVTLSTALHLAIRRRHPIAVGMLVHRGADVNAADATGTTPLSMAANQWKGVLSPDEEMCLESLLTSGKALVDEVSGTHQRTALHLAILAGSALAVEMLLERDADVYVKDGNGKDAFALLKEAKKTIGEETYAQIEALMADEE